MGLIAKSARAAWRVWSGPYSIGPKGKKKRVGLTVALTLRLDKGLEVTEDQFESAASEILRRYATKLDPEE